MDYCLTVLIVIILLIIYFAMCDKVGSISPFRTLSAPSQMGPDTSGAVESIASLEGMQDQENRVGQVTAYDPLTMGAIKKTEVESHYKNLDERSPFATVGSAGPKAYIRDDDQFYRDTGNKWSYRPPCRTFKKTVGGPQAGAREVGSVSAKEIVSLHKSSCRSGYKW